HHSLARVAGRLRPRPRGRRPGGRRQQPRQPDEEGNCPCPAHDRPPQCRQNRWNRQPPFILPGPPAHRYADRRPAGGNPVARLTLCEPPGFPPQVAQSFAFVAPGPYSPKVYPRPTPPRPTPFPPETHRTPPP